MVKETRDNSVDIAKALGIMMVVFCHANFAPASPFRFFHMALFFFLTGWLSSFTSDFRQFVAAKIKHLYLPFVVCELVFLMLHNFLFVRIGLSFPHTMPVWEQLLRIVCFDNIELMLASLWFLPALFFVNMVCYGMIRLLRNRPVLLALAGICTLAAGLLCGRFSWLMLPSNTFSHGVGVVLVAQFFCICGYLLRQADFHFDKWYIALIALVYLYAAKLLLGLSVDMRVNNYSSVTLWMLSVAAGVYFTMWAAGRLSGLCLTKTSLLLAYIGRHSLIILMLHIFCIKLLCLLQVHCFGYEASLLPLWENLSKTWYWALAYAFTGTLLPLVLPLIYDAVARIEALVCVLLWGAVFCGMRGSFQRYPLQVSFAYFCDKPFYNRMGVNPIFNIIKSAEYGTTPVPKQIAAVDEQDAVAFVQLELGIVPTDSIYPIARKGVCKPKLSGMPNVILIFMESMSSANLERTNNKGEYLTPYLRNLRKQSIYCANAFSTGVHTNNGIVGVLYGFVPNFAKTIMDVDAPKYTGLPYYLAQAGYENIAFVTGNPQYDNMNSFWRDNHITEIYSQYDYPREKIVNNFGVPDGYMFEWGLNKLNEKAASGRPFFASFLTVSNHAPFVVPAGYEARAENDELRMIAYADDAVRLFIDAAQQTEWGKQALYILVADHGTPVQSPHEMGLAFNTIPIYLVHPDLTPQTIVTPVSQIDIWPTVLSLLGIEHEINNPGIDYLNAQRRYAFFVSNEHLGVADGEYFYCYSINSDRECLYRIGSGENIITDEPEKAADMREYGFAMQRVNLLAIDKKWTEPRK